MAIQTNPNQEVTVVAARNTHNDFSVYRWQTADEGAWRVLNEGKNYKRALRYFESAIVRAQSANINDFRCGSSLAGKAHACYHLIKDNLYEDHHSIRFVDPKPEYESVLTYARMAVDCFAVGQASPRYQERHARTLYLMGLVLSHLCRGQEAEQKFRESGRLFSDLGLDEWSARSTYMQAKLLLCRRRIANANVLFRQSWQQAIDPVTKARSYLDYVNTLSWIGQLRQAKQAQAHWQQLELANDVVMESVALNFRKSILFAKVDLESGEVLNANKHIQAAIQLCAIDADKIPPLARNVMWTIASRIATARREFDLAEDYFGNNNIDLNLGHPYKGFAELEIIAIDAGCCQCITEFVCVCSNWVCDCCCPAHCYQVCFTEPMQTLAPFNFDRLFASLAKANLGKIQLHRGDVASAESNLLRAINELNAVVHSQSPVYLDILGDILRCKQLQKDKSAFWSSLNRAIDISDLVQRYHYPVDSPDSPSQLLPMPRHPVWGELFSVSGTWRNSVGKYEMAEPDFSEAIRFESAVRSQKHENTLRAYEGLIESQVGDNDPEAARKSIETARELRYSTKICDPGYHLKLKFWCAVVCAVQGDIENSGRKFLEIDLRWNELISEEKYSMSNRGPVVLWILITEVQATEGQMDVLHLYNDFIRLSRVDSDTSTETIAHQLNQTALMLKQYKLYHASRYLYQRAIELYSHSLLPVYQQQVEANLEKLNSIIQEGGDNE